MSTEESTAITTVSDPVERRRLLNIKNQRRYRQRKREELLALRKDARERSQSAKQADTFLQPPSLRDDGVSAATRSGSTARPTNPHGDVFSLDLNTEVANATLDDIFPGVLEAEFLDQSRWEGLDAITSTTVLAGPDLTPDTLGGSYLTEIGTSEGSVNVSGAHLGQVGAMGDHETAEIPASNVTEADDLNSLVPASISHTTISVSHPVAQKANDFADYAITTPGLSVIRAHTEIFRTMIGTEHDLDIFNPTAVSPICHGIIPKLHLPNYEPSPLQRQIHHHPIIDMLPWPSFRDHFLYIMSLPVELRPQIMRCDMAQATLELMLAVKDAGGGIRVWGVNPYLLENWEIGQVFYSKFWWAIDREVVTVSNRIRAARGENALRQELV